MNRMAFARVLAFLPVLTPGFGAAGEHQLLSLVTAQPANPPEVTATGRILPVLRANVGARLSGRIVGWAQTEDKALLDVGMVAKEGQEIFRIDPTTYKARVDVAQAALQRAQAALADLKAGVREESRQALRAAVAEIDARIAERKTDEARFRRLVEEDKTVPVKRLEEVQLQIKVLEEQRRAAQARLAEAEAGPTITQVAVAEAAVAEAKALLATAELDLRDTVIKAPFTGLILQRFKSPGDYLNNAPFTEVLDLASVDALEAELRLPETYYQQIVPGQTKVRLRTPLLKADLMLPVTRVVAAIDPQSGSFAFRVRIPPEQRGQLAGGVFVQGTVILDGAATAVIVPQRAVIGAAGAEGEAAVYVAVDGKMSRRPVVLGDMLTEAVLIKSGLKPGEKVVLGPAEQLKEGAPLPDYLLAR
ncbi:MAG: efflux RND transporter periplasmic adaptor subunit [Planctomycetota bacterium]|nr:efflux RND transporter periplasmic adaptor subunit [Planctomycetota bacterium]